MTSFQTKTNFWGTKCDTIIDFLIDKSELQFRHPSIHTKFLRTLLKPIETFTISFEIAYRSYKLFNQAKSSHCLKNNNKTDLFQFRAAASQ